jgi:hypothetical protein
MAWSGKRRTELPPDWAKRREAVKRRAKGRCEAEQHEPQCDGVGRECDHIGDKLNHSLSNLQWLSTPCHLAKTKRQAAEASQARRAALKLPREAHPSRIRTPERNGWAGSPPAGASKDRRR